MININNQYSFYNDPFPHMIFDNFLDENQAGKIVDEITVDRAIPFAPTNFAKINIKGIIVNDNMNTLENADNPPYNIISRKINI